MAASRAAHALDDDERERYARQLILPGFGEPAQLALKAASVLVVGAGALGSPVALYLAAAGVGRLGIVDPDTVELSNLHRQLLHYGPDLGVPKTLSARTKVGHLNPHVGVEAFPARLERANAEALVLGHDVVVDCSDSWATRFAVNAACCAAGTALVEAGVLGLEGLVLSVRPGRSACYRCVFPRAPDPTLNRSCATAGILGPVAGIVGSLQALEAIKLLTGLGEPLLDRMLEVDGASGRTVEVATRRRPDCPDCGGA